MSLTRRQLKALNLEESAIEEIISAHVKTVDDIRQERDALLKEAEELRTKTAEMDRMAEESARVTAEYDAYRQEVMRQAHQEKAKAHLRTALLDAGANEKAIPLLMHALDPDALTFEGDAPVNTADLIGPVKAAYGDFFSRKTCLPTPPIAPPSPTQGMLTCDDIRRMSESDILNNWSAVRSALTKGV